MSEAYRCDRCAAWDDGQPQGRIVYTPKNFVIRWHIGKSGKELHLCMACGIRFVDWFREVLDIKPSEPSPGCEEQRPAPLEEPK